MNKATIHRLLDTCGLPHDTRASLRQQTDHALEGGPELERIYEEIRRRTKGIPQTK